MTKRRKAAEPKGPPGIPKCPAWLDKRAKAMWRRISPLLFRMGVLSKIDGNALARYCRTYSLWRQADEFIEKNGMAYPTKDASGRITSLQQFPQVGIYNKMAITLTRLEQEFGLTPSARARLHLDVNAASYEDDEFFGPQVSPLLKPKLFGSRAIAARSPYERGATP